MKKILLLALVLGFVLATEVGAQTVTTVFVSPKSISHGITVYYYSGATQSKTGGINYSIAGAPGKFTGGVIAYPGDNGTISSIVICGKVDVPKLGVTAYPIEIEYTSFAILLSTKYSGTHDNPSENLAADIIATGQITSADYSGPAYFDGKWTEHYTGATITALDLSGKVASGIGNNEIQIPQYPASGLMDTTINTQLIQSNPVQCVNGKIVSE